MSVPIRRSFAPISAVERRHESEHPPPKRPASGHLENKKCESLGRIRSCCRCHSRPAGCPHGASAAAPANTFDVLLVRIETDTGLVGWGEAFSRARDLALKNTLETRLLPLIVGRDPTQIAKIKYDLEFQPAQFRA